MTSITEVIVYSYAQTAAAIRKLKMDAFNATEQRIESYMSPRHERWQDYQHAKRRATLLLAARLTLKANSETVPDKGEIGALVSMGIYRSHARTASAQKSLAFSSFRYMRKLDNRLRKQPERFEELEARHA